jgi:glycosyltransferase involved in cell wall biosynthesis
MAGSRYCAAPRRRGAGREDVHILGQVTNEELTALYDVADLFLCASEHEGFCVPIMEAFQARVPVLALAATAVPATMDGGGVLYSSTVPAEVAALMHGIVANPAREDEIVLRQDNALVRLRAKDFDGMVLGYVRQALESPRLASPAVAPDFWRQFKLADELEAIRDHRPAAFRALPLAPEDQSPVADLGQRR